MYALFQYLVFLRGAEKGKEAVKNYIMGNPVDVLKSL